MAETHLKIHREGAVEHVVLNRPKVRNAFNEELIGEMAAWAARAGQNDDIRAAVLSGAGTIFCAGADLESMSKMAGYSQVDNVRDATAAARMFSAWDNLPFPVVTRIHGAAIGGGAGLAAIADIA